MLIIYVSYNIKYITETKDLGLYLPESNSTQLALFVQLCPKSTKRSIFALVSSDLSSYSLDLPPTIVESQDPASDRRKNPSFPLSFFSFFFLFFSSLLSPWLGWTETGAGEGCPRWWLERRRDGAPVVVRAAAVLPSSFSLSLTRSYSLSHSLFSRISKAARGLGFGWYDDEWWLRRWCRGGLRWRRRRTAAMEVGCGCDGAHGKGSVRGEGCSLLFLLDVVWWNDEWKRWTKMCS